MSIKEDFLAQYKELAYRYIDMYPSSFEDIENLQYDDIDTQTEVIIEIENDNINIEIKISNTDFPRNIFIFEEINNIEELKSFKYLLTIKILNEDYNLNNFDINSYLYHENFFGNFIFNNETLFRFHTTEQFKHYFEELRTKQNINNF